MPESIGTAVALTQSAAELCAAGDFARALPLEQRALAITEARLGPGHPDTAARLADLGGSLSRLGRSAEALPLLERALAITEARCGADGEAVVLHLAWLVGPLVALGRRAEARARAERCLELARRHHPGEDARRLLPLAKLAGLLAEAGLREQALPLREEAATLARQCFGDHDLRTVRRLVELGDLLEELGRREEALPVYEAAVAAQAEEDPDRGYVLGLLAGCLQALGRTEEALPVAEAAHRAGGGAISRGNAAIRLGDCLRDLERVAEVPALYWEGVDLAVSPEMREIRRSGLATSLAAAGLPTIAAAVGWRAIRAHAPPDATTARRLEELAGLLHRAGGRAAAREVGRWCQALQGLLLGPQSRAFAQWLTERGRTLLGWEEPAAAAEVLEAALEILGKKGRGADRRFLAVADDLGFLYLGLADPGPAVRVRRAAVERAVQAYGPRSAAVVRAQAELGATWAHFGRHVEVREVCAAGLELGLSVTPADVWLLTPLYANLAQSTAALGERAAARELVARATALVAARVRRDRMLEDWLRRLRDLDRRLEGVSDPPALPADRGA